MILSPEKATVTNRYDGASATQRLGSLLRARQNYQTDRREQHPCDQTNGDNASFAHEVCKRPNDPSSGTRRTGRNDGHRDSPAGLAAAHGKAAISFAFDPRWRRNIEDVGVSFNCRSLAPKSGAHVRFNFRVVRTTLKHADGFLIIIHNRHLP